MPRRRSERERERERRFDSTEIEDGKKATSRSRTLIFRSSSFSSNSFLECFAWPINKVEIASSFYVSRAPDPSLSLPHMRLARGSSFVCGASSRGGVAARPATAARGKVVLPSASPLSKTHASWSSPASTSSRRPLVAASASPGEGVAQATSSMQYPPTGAPREFDIEKRRWEEQGEKEEKDDDDGETL